MASHFGNLLSPVAPALFFERYWGREPLHIPAAPGRSFRELLTLNDLDVLFQGQQLPAAFIDVVQDGKSIPPEEWSRIAGEPRRPERVALTERLFASYSAGATLVITGAFRSIPRLALACRSLTRELGVCTQANIYITPPNAQGFSRHHDDHEVLVLQIHGHKTWRLFPESEPLREIDFQSGDLLYIPRGLAHEAVSVEKPSVHITLGMTPLYAFQLVEELAALAREHPSFQKPVTPTREQGATMEMLETDFLNRLESLLLETPLPALAARRSAELVRNQEKGWEGRLIDIIRLQDLTLDSCVCTRPDQITQVMADEKAVRLEFAGKSITVPLFLRSIVDRLLTGKPVIVRELSGLISEEGKVELVKSWVSAGFLSITN